MSDIIRILYVDDSPLDRAWVLDALEKECGGGIKVSLAASSADVEKCVPGGFPSGDQ